MCSGTYWSNDNNIKGHSEFPNNIGIVLLVFQVLINGIVVPCFRHLAVVESGFHGFRFRLVLYMGL